MLPSGYSDGFSAPRLLPCVWLSNAVNAAHSGADRLVPPLSVLVGQPPWLALQMTTPCAGSALNVTSGTERMAADESAF